MIKINPVSQITKELAIFIPCYNEEKRLQLEPFRQFIKENNLKMDFYFIDDGSTDDTYQLIKENLINNNNSFLIKLDQNLGKGNALRKAILQSKSKDYKFYAFIDADLDIPLNQLNILYTDINNTEYLVAISKRNLSNNISFKKMRSISSVIMVFIANKIIAFNPKLNDTQCGCKLFKREVINSCFEKEFISEWLFDIEIFLRLRKSFSNPRKLIKEVPLENLGKSKNSNFRISQNLKIIKQLYLINKHSK